MYIKKSLQNNSLTIMIRAESTNLWKHNDPDGPDDILGEMLKHSTPELQTAVLTLFNLT